MEHALYPDSLGPEAELLIVGLELGLLAIVGPRAGILTGGLGGRFVATSGPLAGPRAGGGLEMYAEDPNTLWAKVSTKLAAKIQPSKRVSHML